MATSTFLQDHAEAEAMFDRYKDGIGDSSEDGDPAPPPPPETFGQIYQDRVNRARDKAAEGISNPLLRQRFVENTDKVIERGTAHVGGLAETRAATVGRATLLATLDGNLKAAGQAATGPTRADLIFTSVDLIDTGVVQGFLTPAEGQALRKTWPERYGMASLRALPAAERLAVLDRIEAGTPDPAGAPPAAIDRVAGFIGPEGRSALRAEAAREAAEARQGLAAEVAAATGPEIDSIRRTGQETPGFAEKARAVLSTVDMEALGRRTRIAKATHAAGQNMRFMTPEDMAGVADVYRPAGDASAMSGPEGLAVGTTAETAETYAAVRAEAEAIKARRAADPAGYAMQHPAVRAAFNAALGDGGLAGALSGGDGAKLQRAIALRQSLQEAMGIAPADRRLLANDERREMIALLNQAAPEQKPVLLRQLRQALGAQAEDAIAEMADDGLGGGMELVAQFADHPALAAEAAKAMATPYAELIRGIDPADVKALDARLAERVGPWLAAIEKQPGGKQRAAQQSAVVRVVAFARLAQTGDSEGAATSASQEVFERHFGIAKEGVVIPINIDDQATKPNSVLNAAATMKEEAIDQGIGSKSNVIGYGAGTDILVGEPRSDALREPSVGDDQELHDAMATLKRYRSLGGWLLTWADRAVEHFLGKSGDWLIFPRNELEKIEIYELGSERNSKEFVEAGLNGTVTETTPARKTYNETLKTLPDGGPWISLEADWSTTFDAYNTITTIEPDVSLTVGSAYVFSIARLEARREGDTVHIRGALYHALYDFWDHEADAIGPGHAAYVIERHGEGKYFPQGGVLKEPFTAAVPVSAVGDHARRKEVSVTLQPRQELTRDDTLDILKSVQARAANTPARPWRYIIETPLTPPDSPYP